MCFEDGTNALNDLVGLINAQDTEEQEVHSTQVTDRKRQFDICTLRIWSMGGLGAPTPGD